jgi:hypothetical protein
MFTTRNGISRAWIRLKTRAGGRFVTEAGDMQRLAYSSFWRDFLA